MKSFMKESSAQLYQYGRFVCFGIGLGLDEACVSLDPDVKIVVNKYQPSFLKPPIWAAAQ